MKSEQKCYKQKLLYGLCVCISWIDDQQALASGLSPKQTQSHTITCFIIAPASICIAICTEYCEIFDVKHDWNMEDAIIHCSEKGLLNILAGTTTFSKSLYITFINEGLGTTDTLTSISNHMT